MVDRGLRKASIDALLHEGICRSEGQTLGRADPFQPGGTICASLRIPFASVSYKLVWVGLGQISLYLMALVTFSFYVRRWIGARVWRAIHYLSFVVFVLALVHGVFSGTDSSLSWAFWMYVGTGASVLGMTIYRIVARRNPTTAQAQPRIVRGES